MAVFIELTTDPFDAKFADKSKYATATGAGLVSVRRPLRGIEIKDDTHAYLKLIRVDGVEIPLADSSAEGGTSKSYANFILQSVQEQRMERHQIVETFGDTYLFLFGESPRFLNISAMLVNSLDFNWKAEFMQNYELYLRGTKAVEQGARTYLFYDQNIIEGYILNCQVSEDANTPHVVPLSFQLFVTNSQNISLIGEGSDQYPTRASAIVPVGVELNQPPTGEALDALATQGGITPESSFLGDSINRTSPIRSLILDNKDEYTTPLQPTLLDIADERTARAIQDMEAFNQEVDNLESALSDVLQSYGADDTQSPFLMDNLGVGPTFLPGGVGVGSAAGRAGAFATFGATANVSAGAFAGAGVGIGASARASTSLGVGASAGAFAGASFGVGASAGAFAGASPPGFSLTSRGGASFQAGASASAQASAFAAAGASARVGASAFAASNARAAAQAGGYAGAGASLSFSAGAQALAATHAGAGGSAGASVNVAGRPSAFAFVVAQGSVKNVGVAPAVAVKGLQKNYAWSKGWSWP